MIRTAALFALIPIFVFNLFSLASDTRSELYYERLEEAKKGVVLIEGNKIGEGAYANSRDISNKAYTGMGTGIIIDPRGYIVTNQHVVEGLQKIIVTTSEGNKYVGSYLDRDADTDIALIKIDPQETLHAIPIGDSRSVRCTERVVAIGNPFGYAFSFTDGIISALKREVTASEKLSYHNMIQTSASINPGNSGGPLLNQAGEVIAINVAIHSGAQGIAFAMPIDDVMEIGARLINKQTSQFCYHGIRLKPMDEGHSSSRALVVESVDPGSPAENVGVSAGDVIVATNGLTLYREIDFQRAFLEKKANENVDLVVERANEKNISVTMTLRSPGTRLAAARQIQNRVPSQPQVSQRVNPNMTNVSTTPNVQASAPSIQAANPDKAREELIWDVFGIQIRPIEAESLKNYDMNAYLNYPEGVVRIVSIRPDCELYVNGIRAGDYLAGIAAGEAEELRWSISSLSDLSYVAQRWNPQVLGTDVAEIHIIRSKQVSYPRIPISNGTAIASPSRSKSNSRY